jgi:hypothetical protein
MKRLLYLLLVFGFTAINAQTDYSSLGKVIRFSTAYNMFPDSFRIKEPRVYQGKTYDAANHYSDSSAFMFVPAHFDPAMTFSIVCYFHGWNNNIDSALAQFKLVEQFNNAHMNAIFVFPEGPKNAPDSYGGKFEQPGYFDFFMQDVTSELVKNKILKPSTGYDMILAGHSGAYRVMSSILIQSTAHDFRGIILFDALYGQMERFTMYMQWHKSCKLINIYTDNGGTMQNSKDLITDVEAWHRQRRLDWYFISTEEETVTDEQLKRPRLVFLHSKRGHNDVVSNFERFLKSLR